VLTPPAPAAGACANGWEASPRKGAGPWEPCSFTDPSGWGEHGHLSAGPALAPVAQGIANDKPSCGVSVAIPCPPRAPVGYPTQHPRQRRHPTGTQLTQLARTRPSGQAGADARRGPGASGRRRPRHRLRSPTTLSQAFARTRGRPGNAKGGATTLGWVVAPLDVGSGRACLSNVARRGQQAVAKGPRWWSASCAGLCCLHRFR